MSHQHVSLQPKKLLTAIVDNLNRHFYAESRDSAKQLFKQISAGKTTPFIKIDLGESGEVFCELSLDSSKHVGSLNFGKFRKGLAMMLLAISRKLEADEPLNVMHSQTGETLFHIPGFHQCEEGDNVLVCGMQQTAPGMAIIQLMYLDPAQYGDAVRSANPQS